MQVFFWVIDFILPLTMISMGYYYYSKKTHKPISKYSGLRTDATMASRKNWEYAHKLAGKIQICVGIVLSIYALVIKLIQPLPAEWLSLINNTIYIISFIMITAVCANKTAKLGE